MNNLKNVPISTTVVFLFPDVCSGHSSSFWWCFWVPTLLGLSMSTWLSQTLGKSGHSPKAHNYQCHSTIQPIPSEFMFRCDEVPVHYLLLKVEITYSLKATKFIWLMKKFQAVCVYHGLGLRSAGGQVLWGWHYLRLDHLQRQSEGRPKSPGIVLWRIPGRGTSLTMCSQPIHRQRGLHKRYVPISLRRAQLSNL